MHTQIPMGIEVLVKKASVDPAFKAILLERRAGAADEIGLKLDAAEAMMLAGVPDTQLDSIIAHTSVPLEHRRAFLGQAAVAMLAAVGAMAAGAAPAIAGEKMYGGGGMRMDIPENPDSPTKTPVDDPKTIEKQILSLVAKRFDVADDTVRRETSFVEDLKANASQLVNLKRQLEKQFGISIAKKDFDKIRTVGDAIACVQKAVKSRPAPQPATSRGIRPDRPPMGTLGGSRPRSADDGK